MERRSFAATLLPPTTDEAARHFRNDLMVTLKEDIRAQSELQTAALWEAISEQRAAVLELNVRVAALNLSRPVMIDSGLEENLPTAPSRQQSFNVDENL